MNSNPSPEPAISFNPAKAGEEATSAALWELLRRNKRFSAYAQEWIDSERFRRRESIDFEGPKECYLQVSDYVRCALDWMLTPEQRCNLAKDQIRNLTFKTQPEYNFGPILVQKNYSWIREPITRDTIGQMWKVAPDPRGESPLRISQPWDKTPNQFRNQFTLGFKGPEMVCVDPTHNGHGLFKHANQLLGNPDPEEVKQIAQELVFLSDQLRRLGGDFLVFALPRVNLSRRLFDRMMKQIENDYLKAGLKITGPRRFDTRRSFLGTSEDWEWFLESEAQAFNHYSTAEVYLRRKHPNLQWKTRKESKRRQQIGGTIRKHVLAIRGWIDRVYPELIY